MGSNPNKKTNTNRLDFKKIYPAASKKCTYTSKIDITLGEKDGNNYSKQMELKSKQS